MVSSAGWIAGVALAVILIAYVFRFEGFFAVPKEKSRLEFLHERRGQMEENLRDLEFEFRAGKYPAEDYEAQRAQLECELAALQSEMAAQGQPEAQAAGEGGSR